jgi:uncharacterized protein (TIGR00251 family)
MLKEFKRQLEEKSEIYLRIAVRPGTSKTAIKEIMDNGTIKIDIAALPVKGKANQELIKFLAQKFDVSQNNVKIIKGFKEKIKLIKIKNDF